MCIAGAGRDGLQRRRFTGRREPGLSRSVDEPEFELAPYAPNQTIVAGGQSEIRVRYHPTDIGPDTGPMFVAHLAATVPVAVPLTGDGGVTPTVSDDFEQPRRPRPMCCSWSTTRCRWKRSRAFWAQTLVFFTYARNENIDYHIAVTTTDVDPDGEVVDLWCTDHHHYAEHTGSRGRLCGECERRYRGEPERAGLQAAYLALSDPLINTAGTPALRPDAALCHRLASDEEDSSPQTDAFYESFFRNIKGFRIVDFSPLAPSWAESPPFPCNGPGGEAFYGGRYIQLATATNGVVESILPRQLGTDVGEHWGDNLGLRQFTLSSNPAPSTIQVQVSGTVIPATGAAGPCTGRTTTRLTT